MFKRTLYLECRKAIRNRLFVIAIAVGCMLLAEYTVYATRKITALMICSARELALNRFVRYCGIVIESPHTMENERSRGAIKIQLSE